MAIIKVVKKSGKTFTSLRKVLSYVGEKAIETFGINCDTNYKKAAKEFLETKKFFEKENGRQYRHYIQSFKPGEIEKEKIMEFSLKWCEQAFPGHEVFLAVHNDKDHLHTHCIVNTVNFENGVKLHENAHELDLKKKLNDEISKEYGIINNFNPRKEGDVIAYDKNKYQIIKKSADITNLAQHIINTMQISLSKKDFIKKMKEKGYKVEWEDNKKHVVFKVDTHILEGKKDKFRLSNLQKTFNISNFSQERLLEIFQQNSKQIEAYKLDEIAKNMMFDELDMNKLETSKTIEKSKLIQKKSSKKTIDLQR